MIKHLVLVSVLGLGFTACGSSDSVAATAAKGDAFCKSAETAKVDNDALNAIDGTDTTKIKLELGGAIDSLTTAVAKAPKDIVVTAKTLLSKEVELESLLKKNDYDVVKMSSSAEGKKLLADDSAKKAGDDFDKYLSDKCGIAPSDTTPSDTTPLDTTVSGDTSVDTIVDLGEGEAAINKFLDFYELGTSSTLTADERSCIVSNLVDKVTGADLNQAIAGQASSELQQALGLAFINCNVTVQS
ncbi:MAG: hypothetical protein ABI706_17015 [Ilumatobacteraceae bacterium]